MAFKALGDPTRLLIASALDVQLDAGMIAREIGGSFRTIETHRGHVMTKMAAGSLADLVRASQEVRVGAVRVGQFARTAGSATGSR